jgi:hypothetical protein
MVYTIWLWHLLSPNLHPATLASFLVLFLDELNPIWAFVLAYPLLRTFLPLSFLGLLSTPHLEL